MQCPQISDEKITSFAPLMNIFLIRFLKDQKLYVKEAKLFFFIENLRALHLLFAGTYIRI